MSKIAQIKKTIADHADMFVIGVVSTAAIIGCVVLAKKQMDADAEYAQQVNDFVNEHVAAGHTVLRLFDGSYYAYDPK